MKKAVVFTLLALLTFALYGCGSGDFSSGTTVSGMGAKGPVSGGKVAIFSVTTSAHIGKQLATGTTSASGAFSADLGGYTGAIFATMSGSSASYTDEATNTTQTLGSTRLHAAAVVATPGPFNLAITPFTELAYQKAATLKPADITTANTLISNQFLAGSDIISTLPANIQSTAPAVTDPDKIKYSLALATFSQLISGGTSIDDGIAQLSAAITDGTVSSVWSSAVGSLASNTTFTTNFQSGLLTAPVSIVFSSPTYSAIINQAVTITANVTKFDGTAVPAGTKVTFTSSGGSLGTPTTTTDASGNATVVLTPSAVGTVKVTATASASGVTVTTKTAAVVSVVRDPNDPGSVTLASSSSTAQVGQSVTLSATVGVAGGGPNNVTPGSAPNPAATVTFKITSGTGTLSSVTATTDTSGVATVTLTSATANTVTVTASAGTDPVVTSSPVTVTFTPDPTVPATITVSASPSSVPADGNTTSTITANVKNFAGTVLSGQTVSFSTTGGTLSATSATTDGSGNATVTLTGTATGSVTVTATAGGKSGSTQVTFTTRPTKAVVILSTSGTFTSGTAIGTINCDVTFPNAKGLTLSTAVLSGGTTSVSPTPTLVSNVATAGDLSLALQANLSGSTTVGFPLGQFATVTFTIPSGTTLPVTGDFAVASGSEVTNTSGSVQSGISVNILSVTFQ
ncbi:Ig-like domain-containing protein [Geobacter sp. AOG2]|uniref:beta strand repeat-containing protein n=1 Tax=Geobacter sp. AOG2 TaxID=1566347 RepID=UPI001CC54AEE|nr:Ig-like domain-containing protein [Geobacter sp. AOG2]GFE62103.1 hypothetical protein AOG2_26910 [Geobacter sp. AOG2]